MTIISIQIIEYHPCTITIIAYYSWLYLRISRFVSIIMYKELDKCLVPTTLFISTHKDKEDLSGSGVES